MEIAFDEEATKPQSEIEFHYRDHQSKDINLGDIAAIYFSTVPGTYHVMGNCHLNEQERKDVSKLMQEHHATSIGVIKALKRRELTAEKEKTPNAAVTA